MKETISKRQEELAENKKAIMANIQEQKFDKKINLENHNQS